MRVIAVFGPTGVGKTAVAIAVAERLRARGEDPVAVSADAMQVYAGLPILTGAADAHEQAELEHRLLGFVPVDQTYSAGAFAKHAHATIDALLAQGRRPIVVGGTGLYLRAALADLDLRPPVDPEIRARLAARDIAELHAELPASLGIKPTDTHRIIRAHELLAVGEQPPSGDQLWTEHTRHPTLLAALVMDRERLYERINARVDAMVAAGAEAEVRAVADRASATARRAVGFEELLAGDVERMKTNTRRYAKRQLTWLRKLPGAHLVDMTDRGPEDVAAELVAMI
ncbi:tRNA dimethylallyltransferase [Solirubrobacter pauli]|uniref:tRNA dimethylallyltransferase n=1 Tax=Solirubrobacter pauli TaxID=166793 RepID=A0A660L0Q9_9ACTN|nr:tRNA (adenosine(37)-N6)-dimethylallyltransferase MiaA [Solirubrobacter pauli]RKQ87446.1 tRNA dimethylallyltransferase [Solirubrobacter pauli]